MARDLFHLGYSLKMLAEGSDTAELMLYGEIVEDGPKWWKWSQEDKSAAEFDKAIKEIRANGATKLLLRINSPGGVCTEAVAMRAILGNAGFEEVNIRIEGMCASAATDIATLPGAHVAICEGSEYMIHNPWCWAMGNANELEQTIERLRNIEKTSRAFYAKKSGQSEEQIKDWMDAETWFTAEEAVEYGFADELLEAEVKGETPAAACVSSREMAVMHGLYKAVPAQVVAQEPPQEAAPEGEGAEVSNEAPVAGASTEINHEEEHDTMDIKDLNMDQLRADNPALLEQIQQAALEADRQRREDIDAITPPIAEYQAMAEEAKQKGTPFTDYQRQIVAAQKKKGADYLASRKAETDPAQNVQGDAAEGQNENEEQKIRQNAEEMAKYAKEYRGNPDGGMY